MRIAACDDEEFFLNQLEIYCHNYQSETGIPVEYHKFNNGEETLEYFQKYPETDMFILDIKMPGINGAEVAELIRSRNSQTFIVFLTGIMDYILKGYEIGINRYWIKPLSYKKFQKEMNLLFQKKKETNQKYLIERIGGTTERISFENIIYIETIGRKTLVHKKDGSYESTTTMADYIKKLDERFYRCHAAYIVNMLCIIKIDGMEILLDNGDTIYTSKGKRRAFIQAFHRCIRDK